MSPRPSTAAQASTLPSDTAAPPRPPVDEGTPVDDPERYELIGEHARGGLGRVIRAIDRRLGRTVAVKELLRRGDSNESRFLREALITARLEHPGIVPVHEAGRWPNGDPYYVMKLVEGRTLKELIAERHTLRERLELLQHVIAVADAVGYAHSEGVIHRDLKPSNVIVGEFGETIVVDWGLARDCKHNVPEPHEDLTLAGGSGASTVSGKVIGTPAYMSPEQARGELVDERADVYALGAVLYELLAGVPAHHDTTPHGTLERVIAGPPKPLCLAAPQAPVDLVTIVTKAMNRTPDARYVNATALAEDLRRFSCGKLVSAHSYSTWALLRKKVSQHRGVVAMAAASALVLGAVGVESVRRVVAERNIAQGERARALDAQTQAEKRQSELVLLQAVTSLRKDPTATLAWLKDYPIGDKDRAHVLDVVDEALALGVAQHVFRPGDWVHDAVFTPDGTAVVALVRNGAVRRYDLRTGAVVELGRVELGTDALAVSPDGTTVVIGSMNGEVTAWSLDGSAPPRVLSRKGSAVRGLKFSIDGRQVLVARELLAPEIVPLDGSPGATLDEGQAYKGAVADRDWSRRVLVTAPNVLAIPTPEGLKPIAKLDKSVLRVVLSPTGDRVVVFDGAAVHDLAYEGGPVRRLVDYPNRIQQVMWSPDGSTMAIAGERHDLLLIDVASGAVRELRGHTDTIYTVAWSRDGRRLLTASDDGTARLFNITDGTSTVLRGHDDDVWRARFSPDETQVVTASLDGSVRVWRIDQPGARSFTEGSPIRDMNVSGDRAVVHTAAGIARWDLAAGTREQLSTATQGQSASTPDGQTVITLGSDWTLEMRRAGAAPLVMRGHKLQLTHHQFSSDGKSLYTSSMDGTLRRWDVATGESTVLADFQAPLRIFAVAPDGRIAVGMSDRTAMLYPDGTRRELGVGMPWCMAKVQFEPVRQRLVFQRCDHGIVLVDDTRRIDLSSGNYVATHIVVSPDGARIAAAMNDRTVRLWDAASGNVLAILRGHTDLVWEIAFSPDGTQLASASYDRTVRVWELSSHRHRVLRGHSGSVQNISWNEPDRIVTSSTDGTIRIWNVPTLEIPQRETIIEMLNRATTARIEVDRPTTMQPVRRGT